MKKRDERDTDRPGESRQGRNSGERKPERRTGRETGERPFNRFRAREEDGPGERREAPGRRSGRFSEGSDDSYRRKPGDRPERRSFSDSERFSGPPRERAPRTGERGDRETGQEPGRYTRRPFDSRKNESDFRGKPRAEGRFGDRRFERDETPESGRRDARAGERGDRFPRERPARFSDQRDRERGPERPGRFQKPEERSFRRTTFKSAPEKRTPAEAAEKDGQIRLNRFIAHAGICSRREADELIEAGQITVNGKTVTEMGYKVGPTDVVKYGKRVLNAEKLVYVLLNKPKGFITTTEDPEERKTVLDLIEGACKERVYPVGRLDRNTTGLLLLTNDGELADKLTHPSNEIKKIYQAELDKPITLEDFETLKKGIELEDGFVKPDDVGIVTPDAYVVGIEIHSGRNRIVRRMFEFLGYEVTKLDRTVFAGLNKKDLPRGKWRLLTEKEIVTLKYLV